MCYKIQRTNLSSLTDAIRLTSLGTSELNPTISFCPAVFLIMQGRKCFSKEAEQSAFLIGVQYFPCTFGLYALASERDSEIAIYRE